MKVCFDLDKIPASWTSKIVEGTNGKDVKTYLEEIDIFYSTDEQSFIDEYNESIQNPKSVKHGHWELVHPLQDDDEGAYMCSECRTGDYGVERYSFCPFCGTKMDEVV